MRDKWKLRWDQAGSRKRYTALALMMAVVLAAGVLLANSRSLAVDLETPKRVSLKLSEESMLSDFQSANVVFDVYRVADAVPVGGFDTYDLSAVGAFADLKLEGELDQQQYNQMAQDALEIVLSNEVEPIQSDVPFGTEITNLDAGMYLIVPHGSGMEKEAYGTDTRAGLKGTIAQSVEYEYTFLPHLIALPTKKVENETFSTAGDNGPWMDEAEVELKVTREPRLGNLIIEKVIDGLEEREGVLRESTFVFSVKGVLNGEVVYDNVVSIPIKEGVSGTAELIGKIPVGSVVTVEEIYSGAAYDETGVSPSGGVITISDAEQNFKVTFENVYNGDDHDGGSATNHFDFKKDGGWSWSGTDDAGNTLGGSADAQ